MKKILAVLLLSAFVLGACGDDDDSGGGDAASGPLVDAMTAAIVEDADEDTPFGETEARCFAGNFVGAVGEDRLAELGVTAEGIEGGEEFEDFDWTEDELTAAGDAITDCLDITEILTETLAGSGLDEEQARCLAEGIPEDAFRDAIVVGITGVEDPEAEARMDEVAAEAAADCGLS